MNLNSLIREVDTCLKMESNLNVSGGIPVALEGSTTNDVDDVGCDCLDDLTIRGVATVCQQNSWRRTTTKIYLFI